MAEAFLDFILASEVDKLRERVAMNFKSQITKEDPSQRSGNNRTYPGDVTDSELAAMKLSAKLCKKTNSVVSTGKWI